MAANKKGSGKRPMNAKEIAKKKRKKIILFVIEIFILLIMLVVLYGVIKTEKIGKITINEEDIIINDKAVNSENMEGFRNIALFGVDSTNGALGKGTRTDTIMVASINEKTHEVKLVSVYRDTYLNLSNDTYDKCNTAYAQGGPKQAINMLNMNMDLDITDYVTAGFVGLVDTIDELGGIEIEVDEAEISHLNNYQIGISGNLKRSYTPLKSTGKQLLDGLQATAYCRIRYTKGDDFKRAERQREVLTAVAEKAKKASPSTLNGIANKVFPQISTSLDLDEILSLLSGISEYEVGESNGFPFATNRATGNLGKVGSSVIAVTLEENVQLLHDFFFADETYVPSDTVKELSSTIESKTASYIGKNAAKSSQKESGGASPDTLEGGLPIEAPPEEALPAETTPVE